jgi:hypothetical protein
VYGQQKDVVILELQQAASTACASLESEKKQVEGESLSDGRSGQPTAVNLGSWVQIRSGSCASCSVMPRELPGNSARKRGLLTDKKRIPL